MSGTTRCAGSGVLADSAFCPDCSRMIRPEPDGSVWRFPTHDRPVDQARDPYRLFENWINERRSA